MPVMLPVILQNRDFIGLSDQQVAELDDWRSKNTEPMLTAMKEIVEKRVAIREAAISPTVTTSPTPSRQRPVAGSWAPFTEGDIQAPSSWSRRHRLTQEHPGPVAPFREGDGQVQSL